MNGIFCRKHGCTRSKQNWYLMNPIHVNRRRWRWRSLCHFLISLTIASAVYEVPWYGLLRGSRGRLLGEFTYCDAWLILVMQCWWRHLEKKGNEYVRSCIHAEGITWLSKWSLTCLCLPLLVLNFHSFCNRAMDWTTNPPIDFSTWEPVTSNSQQQQQQQQQQQRKQQQRQQQQLRSERQLLFSPWL